MGVEVEVRMEDVVGWAGLGWAGLWVGLLVLRCVSEAYGVGEGVLCFERVLSIGSIINSEART